MLIRIYGDSLALPRLGEGVPCESTYGELLAARIGDLTGEQTFLYNRSRGAATIRILHRDFLQDEGYSVTSSGRSS